MPMHYKVMLLIKKWKNWHWQTVYNMVHHGLVEINTFSFMGNRKLRHNSVSQTKSGLNQNLSISLAKRMVKMAKKVIDHNQLATFHFKRNSLFSCSKFNCECWNYYWNLNFNMMKYQTFDGDLITKKNSNIVCKRFLRLKINVFKKNDLKKFLFEYLQKNLISWNIAWTS